jgi:1,5-anhydro-D-fructose reductase (1,5-anhydro-D-mannitol-forming)
VSGADGVLGWGIVGLGRVANDHIAPAITALPNSSLVAVASRDATRAAAFAERHGAPVPLDSYPDLLANPAVQAVYIATPNSLHADQVVAAADAGKHVLCDKPLATTVPDAQRAIDACARAGVGLGVTFQTRNYDGMADMRTLIGAGQIGDVVVAQLEMSPGRTLLKGWRTDPSLAGAGVMNNVGVHGYDLLRYLLDDEIVEVSAMLSSEPGFELDTTALALLRFAGGALAYVNVNQTVPDHQPDLVIYGASGRVLGRNVTRPNLAGTLTVTGTGGASERPVSSATAFATTVGDFADAVLAGRDPSPSALDALVSVRVTDALERSARERRVVRLAE